MSESSANLDLLRKQYGPLLDDSLVYAVASDYDLSDEHSRSALVTLLKELNESAAINEALNGEPVATEPSASEHDSRTTLETDRSRHNVTSATSDLSNLNLSASSESLSEDLEHLSDIDKRKYLRDLFPGTTNDQIAKVLSENGSLRTAIDELLSEAFMSTYDQHSDDDRPAIRGIDAFAEDLRPERGRKHRSKKNRTTDSSRTNSAGSFRAHTPSNSNAWTNGDVEFICSRTMLNIQAVGSVYHSKNANLATTIKELADREKAKLPDFAEADALVQAQVIALREDFPEVTPSRIQALLHLARNIPSATGELLESMLHRPTSQSPPRGKLNGVVTYTPLKIDETDNSASSNSWSLLASPISSINPHANHSHAASHAFTSASTAARRAKSDRLMGGAAAYYASIGHEHIRLAKSQTSAAADALVSQQSTSNMIDLHGVSVADAVRIASARTQRWWEGLGDARFGGLDGGRRGGARGAFQIVTGVGTHSKNNAPRIGPAVAKRLVGEGWKVEVDRGEIWVLGKARR